MEDIVELGGWVEPDVPWPKLVYLQVLPGLFLSTFKILLILLMFRINTFKLKPKNKIYKKLGISQTSLVGKHIPLQMSAATKSGHDEVALSLSRGLVTTLSGSSSEHTLQLYR